MSDTEVLSDVDCSTIEITTLMAEALLSMFTFRYAGKSLEVPHDSIFVPYATFFAGEYDFLNINKRDVVLDVGANIGDFTLLASLKANKVIAIEPNMSTFALLRRNVQSLDNVILINKAVGDVHKFVSIEGNGVSAFTVEDHGGAIEMDRIDDLLSTLSISPTILKMDIEGFEFNALKDQKFVSRLRRAVIETHSAKLAQLCESLLNREGFQTNCVTTFSVALRTIRNILRHPYSFLAYENETNFYAMGQIYNFIRTGTNPIPSCGGHELKLIQAWK